MQLGIATTLSYSMEGSPSRLRQQEDEVSQSLLPKSFKMSGFLAGHIKHFMIEHLCF